MPDLDEKPPPLSVAAKAGPPSPEKPWLPLPAMVVITPWDTFLIRAASAIYKLPEASNVIPVGM